MKNNEFNLKNELEKRRNNLEYKNDGFYTFNKNKLNKDNEKDNSNMIRMKKESNGGNF